MHLSDVLFWAIIAAMIFVLVRPNSPGPAFVAAIGNAASTVVGAATGAAFTT